MPVLTRLRSVARSALSLRAAAAFLLLAAIATDVAADSRCHPGPRVEEASTVSASRAESSEDPCAEGCVADCYCCSALAGTSIFRVPEADRPMVALLVTVDPACAPGVVPAPYHPPLALA